MAHIGILNAHMFGAAAVPGEHVEWSTPEVAPEADWADLFGQDVADYAAANPHMIVWQVGE